MISADKVFDSMHQLMASNPVKKVNVISGGLTSDGRYVESSSLSDELGRFQKFLVQQGLGHLSQPPLRNREITIENLCMEINKTVLQPSPLARGKLHVAFRNDMCIKGKGFEEVVGGGVACITFAFDDGVHEGQLCKGTILNGFLPTKDEKSALLDLLKKAFDQQVLFKVELSKKNPEHYVIKLADGIELKNELKNFDGYLQRLEEKLYGLLRVEAPENLPLSTSETADGKAPSGAAGKFCTPSPLR